MFQCPKQKVAEPAALLVPGVLDESRVGDRQRSALGVQRPGQAMHQDQGAGVVVHAIAVAAVGQTEQAVLQYPAAVGQAKHRRQAGRQARGVGGACRLRGVRELETMMRLRRRSA